MSGRPRRPAHAAPTAAAPAEPAIEAAADRAAVEREHEVDPAAAPAPVPVPAIDSTADVPSDLVAATDAAVLPEPAIVAEPGEPQPLVTASPPLAAEPSATDVAKAEAEAVGAGDPSEAFADRDGPHPVAGGQPTLAIEPSRLGNVAPEGSAFVLEGDRVRFDREVQAGRIAVDAEAEAEEQADREYLRRIRRNSELPPGVTWEDHMRSVFGPDYSGAESLPGYFNSAGGSPSPVETGRVTVVEVRGPSRGFRRAGFLFGPEPRRFLHTTLTDAQFDAIMDEPMLVVGTREMDADEAAKLLGL